MNFSIPFNKPFIGEKETQYIVEAVRLGHISGNGKYTKLCQEYFTEQYGFRKCLLTTSCTDALEMAAILCDIEPGDEVIIPSFTFVSTALAFVRQGANIVFADSRSDHPGIDELAIEKLVTSKTKAIVVVHYAGVSCDMDVVTDFAHKYNLLIIEDAAHAVDSSYIDSIGNKKPLGSIGHLACFSFHETKNIQCGEGGMLVINDERFVRRSEIIWEKGTNRAAFFRGEIDKYGWVDTGSSFLPSDINAAFLYAQLEQLEQIQTTRCEIWNGYFNELSKVSLNAGVRLPFIPEYATNNAHMFYLLCKDIEQRGLLISHLQRDGIKAVFHYQSLHNSEYYRNKHDGRSLPHSDYYSDCLVRLPFFYELFGNAQKKVTQSLMEFFS